MKKNHECSGMKSDKLFLDIFCSFKREKIYFIKRKFTNRKLSSSKNQQQEKQIRMKNLILIS